MKQRAMASQRERYALELIDGERFKCPYQDICQNAKEGFMEDRPIVYRAGKVVCAHDRYCDTTRAISNNLRFLKISKLLDLLTAEIDPPEQYELIYEIGAYGNG